MDQDVDRGIFPTDEAKKGLWAAQTYDARTDRTVTRLWTKIKSGT